MCWHISGIDPKIVLQLLVILFIQQTETGSAWIKLYGKLLMNILARHICKRHGRRHVMLGLQATRDTCSWSLLLFNHEGQIHALLLFFLGPVLTLCPVKWAGGCISLRMHMSAISDQACMWAMRCSRIPRLLMTVIEYIEPCFHEAPMPGWKLLRACCSSLTALIL